MTPDFDSMSRKENGIQSGDPGFVTVQETFGCFLADDENWTWLGAVSFTGPLSHEAWLTAVEPRWMTCN